MDNLLRKTVYSCCAFTPNMHNIPMHLRCKATAWYLFICMHACNNFTNCMLFHENYDMQPKFFCIQFPHQKRNKACITLHIFTSKSAWYLILHACPYQHFSLKRECYLNKNTTHVNWKFFPVFLNNKQWYTKNPASIVFSSRFNVITCKPISTFLSKNSMIFK